MYSHIKTCSKKPDQLASPDIYISFKKKLRGLETRGTFPRSKIRKMNKNFKAHKIKERFLLCLSRKF